MGFGISVIAIALRGERPPRMYAEKYCSVGRMMLVGEQGDPKLIRTHVLTE